MAVASSEPVPRILVAGVGYQNLCDLSVGPGLVSVLRALPWALPVEVDEASSQAKLEHGVLSLTLAKKTKPATQLSVA